jgi:cysteinyl-tRNA synthetase
MALNIFLHNTLTGKKEIFVPLVPGRVSMYNCGPTVYHYAHIGNLRSYIFADVLRRVFEWNGLEVRQVINITDVGHMTLDGAGPEDKMEKGAEREGKTAREIAVFYTDAFFTDLDHMNIPREKILFPRATEYIAEQIDMIQALEKKNCTYRIADGIYFDTSKFSEYGKLGNINLSGLEEGARIGVNTEKKHATDFALWKFSPADHKREMEWESPWGVGFPGWHIECSAMSKTLLGETFDVHTGGIDHIPVHHNNEIAQSETANEKQYVRYWLHNAFLTVGEQQKMSKSDDNFIRLQTLVEKNIDPLAYRYLMLTAKYSSLMQFSWEALLGAQTALKRLRDFMAQETKTVEEIDPGALEILASNKRIFTEYINDDLDTPQALALVWQIMKDDRLSLRDRQSQLLEFDRVLGLKLGEQNMIDIPVHVQQLIQKRDAARAEKDFALSDSLRAEIESLGFEVMDTTEGTKVTPR